MNQHRRHGDLQDSVADMWRRKHREQIDYAEQHPELSGEDGRSAWIIVVLALCIAILLAAAGFAWLVGAAW